MSRSRRNRDEAFGDDLDDDEVEHGIRRARRDTPYEYRASSSLWPAQIMEREVYYYVAMDILQQSSLLAGIIAILTLWNNIMSNVANATANVRQTIKAIKNLIKRLLFLMQWVASYGELALLYAEDLSVFVRRRNRFQPIRHRTIDDIDAEDCYSFFGLTRHELRRLFVHWRIPATFQDSSHHVFRGEECFLITLYHMVKGVPFTAMARHTFGGDPRRMSDMFRLTINHLYFTFYNKISGTSLEQWIPRHVHLCRRLIHNALSQGMLRERTYVNGVLVDEAFIRHHFDFDTFRIFSFLDDYAMAAARVADSVRRREDFCTDIQRAFYSGYLRAHGLKAQVVYLPIGIIGSVFITEIRQNDNGVQNMSGINNYLVILLAGIFIGGLYPCLYVDGIFAVLATIVPRFSNPTPALHLLNIRLASLRESIEHVFADHTVRFKIFSVPSYLRLFHRGVMIRRMCLVSFFMLNSYYCIGGSRCRYFGHIPPTLEEYIPLDEVLQPPPAVNLGEVWDFGQNA